MNVTAKELQLAGADMANGYLYRISDPIGTTVKNGCLQSLWSTNRLKKAIEAKRYCHIGNENVSTGCKVMFTRSTNRLLKAISKLEKKHEVIKIMQK
jgi:hypothetical protein